MLSYFRYGRLYDNDSAGITGTVGTNGHEPTARLYLDDVVHQRPGRKLPTRLFLARTG